MKFGVCVPNYGETYSKETLRSVASEAERLGYDSIWCTDHTLMPRNSNTPYERILDSLTTLSYLAAVTDKVRLGISSLITAMRNPVIVAKQLATIDNLSNGRVMLATSVGWNQQEFTHLGSNFHNRGQRLDASIKLIRALWSGKTKYDSKTLHIKFDDAVFQPPPIQQHLTIWIAGNSPAAMKRAATLGDAWHPNVQPLDEFAKLVSEFRQNYPDAKDKPICVRIALNVKAEKSEYLSPQGQKRVMLSANRSDNKKMLEKLKQLGVSYCVVAPNPNGKISVADQIDGMKMVSEEFF